MSQKCANSKHKCEPTPKPEEYCQDCLGYGLLMNQILVQVPLNMAVVVWVLLCKLVNVSSHMLCAVEDWPVVNRCLSVSKHLSNMLFAWQIPCPLNCDSVGLWQFVLKWKPVQIRYLVRIFYHFIVKVDMLSVCEHHHHLAVEPGSSGSISFTEWELRSGTSGQENVDYFVFHIVEWVVDA